MPITTEHAGARRPDAPLAPHAGFLAAFGLALVALVARRRTHEPERVRPMDAIATAMATHALTRIVTSSPLAAPRRAPFVGDGHAGAVRSRSHGVRRAIGELVTCCTEPWVALTLVAGWLEAPRATRVVTWVLAAASSSSWLGRAYDALGQRQRSGEPEVRFVAVRADAEDLDDGQQTGVMTRHVEIHPDDVPETSE